MPDRCSCMTSAENAYYTQRIHAQLGPISDTRLYIVRAGGRPGLTNAAESIDGHVELLGLSDLLRALGALHACFGYKSALSPLPPPCSFQSVHIK